jgi:chemotaxis methyl-accepting protein methylase
MHRLMAGVTILEHELSELRLLVERRTGVLLDCPNSALAAHVAEYLETQELESPAALLERLRSTNLDPAVLAGFLDGILNVSTGFFRHPGAMNALARQVAPQLYGRKSEDGACTLRIWSAGCGTGEEAYSIAMALCEAMPNGNGSGNGSNNGNGAKDTKAAGRGGIAEGSAPANPVAATKDWSIHIVGSDLLSSAIRTAERGLYPQSALAGLPPTIIRACFSKIGNSNGNGAQEGIQSGANGSANVTANISGNGSNGTHLLVKPRLRSMVTFNTMNLTKPVYI